MSNTYYTVYLNNTDDIVASGTAVECSQQMRIKTNHFYSIVSKSNRGIHHKYTIIKEKTTDYKSMDV